MSGDGREAANEEQQKPTRRASDKPHVFERNKGFRTCRACGLPKNHEVHNAKRAAKYAISEEPQSQSIEQLREQLSDNLPRPVSRFTLSRIALVSAGFVVVVVGLVSLAVFRFNHAVDKPLQEVLKDPSNQLIRASAHLDRLDSATLVFDLTEASAGASRLDVVQPLLQYAAAMKERHFSKVILSYRGVRKFTLQGDYFQQLGQEYRRENPVPVIRTLPAHLAAMDGTKPFSEQTGELLSVATNEVEQFTQFGDQWYAHDAAVSSQNEVSSSTAAAAEPIASTTDSPSNNYWLALDSRNETDNSPEVSLQNSGTGGAVLTIRCANRETEAYVDTDAVLSNKSVRVRFDDSVPVRQYWYRSASDKALFAPDAIVFARRLANTHTFRLEFTPFEEQERIVAFDVSGLNSQLKRISNSCDWSSIDNSHAKVKVARSMTTSLSEPR